MSRPRVTFQIGKNGVTDGTIELLNTAFKNRNQIKIALMKGAGHTKEKAEEIGQEIVNRMGKNYIIKKEAKN